VSGLNITYLGHAGFCVETTETIIIMDPWLSPSGAFDYSWFQYPCNHHLAAFVQEKLSDTTKKRFIYISHEHKDHFDAAFLSSLKSGDFHFIVPRFRRKELIETLSSYRAKGVIAARHGQLLHLGDVEVVLFLDDAELDRDSAILVRHDDCTFLNLNDCKLYDYLSAIKERFSKIDVFACQFSGAVWHPVCYDYSKREYERITKQKVLGKFNAVLRAIEILAPQLYIPSAGPACFLDPTLLHLNFSKNSIFTHAEDIVGFLRENGAVQDTTYSVFMPGDKINIWEGIAIEATGNRVESKNRRQYIKEYSLKYRELFEAVHKNFTEEQSNILLLKILDFYKDKLEKFALRSRISTKLYISIKELTDKFVEIDFVLGEVFVADRIVTDDYYVLSAPAWSFQRVIDDVLSWEDLMHSFRIRLRRNPDIYQPLIHGFLVVEPDDLISFCDMVLSVESFKERIEVEADGKVYLVDRVCPHQGADLSQGWIETGYLVCPRHRWRFDLANGGKCTTTNASINAIPHDIDSHHDLDA
jgi:UDP-MurNAc hydroxylase